MPEGDFQIKECMEMCHQLGHTSQRHTFGTFTPEQDTAFKLPLRNKIQSPEFHKQTIS